MSRFRVGEYSSLVMDMGYVIQKKHWWGWSNWCHYDSKKDAKEDAKMLEKNGHIVDWYI